MYSFVVDHHCTFFLANTDGDMKLYGDSTASYEAVAQAIDGVEGVVAHGLFADVKPVAAVVAMPQGPPMVLVQGERITSDMPAGASDAMDG